MLVTQWHSPKRKNIMFKDAFVVGRQNVVSSFIDLFDTLPAIDHIDEPGRHPMAPLFVEVRFQILIEENRIAGDDDLTGASLDTDALVARGMAWRRKNADAGDNFSFPFNDLKVATGEGRFNTKLR